MKTKDNDMVVTYDPKTKIYTNTSGSIKIQKIHDARAYNKLLNEPTATPAQIEGMTKRIENARAYSGALKKEEGLFESIITNLVRTTTPTPTRPIEITQREDPDLYKGIGSIYKPI